MDFTKLIEEANKIKGLTVTHDGSVPKLEQELFIVKIDKERYYCCIQGKWTCQLFIDGKKFPEGEWPHGTYMGRDIAFGGMLHYCLELARPL